MPDITIPTMTNNSGLVGVGTINPTELFHVQGTITASVVTASFFKGYLFGTATSAISASWASSSLSSSYLVGTHLGNTVGTSSWANNSIVSLTSLYASSSRWAISSSFASSSISASYLSGSVAVLKTIYLPDEISYIGSIPTGLSIYTGGTTTATVGAFVINSTFIPANDPLFTVNGNSHFQNITASQMLGTASYANLAKSASYYPPQIYQANTISASFASSSISSSFAITASYFNQKWLNTGSLYPITSSWTISSSYVKGAVNGTSSWSNNSIISTTGLYASQSRFSTSSSWATSSLSSSYSRTSSFAINTLTASYVGSGTDNYIPKWSSNTLTPTSLIYDDGSNVGIGTNNPIYSLTVKETANSSILGLVVDDATSRFPGIYLINGSTVEGSFKLEPGNISTHNVIIEGGSGISSYIAFKSSGSGVTILNPNREGNVGVGVNIPQAMLHVMGPISASSFGSGSFQGTSSWANSSSFSVNAANISGGTDDYVAVWNGTSALTTGLIRDDGDCVGIGTVPIISDALIVRKTYSDNVASEQYGIRSAMIFSGTGSNFRQSFRASSNISHITGTMTNYTDFLGYITKNEGGDSTILSTLYCGGIITSGSISNRMGVYVVNLSKTNPGTVTSEHGVYINDLTGALGHTSGIRTLLGNRSNTWNIYAEGTAPNYFAGNLGLGTQEPTTKLEINGGGILMTGGSSISSSFTELFMGWRVSGGGWSRGIGWISGSVVQAIVGGYGNGTTGVFDYLYFGSGSSAFQNPWMVIKDGGNVGIRTTNPQSKFHVVGHISASGFGSGSLQGTSSWSVNSNISNTSLYASQSRWVVSASFASSSISSSYSTTTLGQLTISASIPGATKLNLYHSLVPVVDNTISIGDIGTSTRLSYGNFASTFANTTYTTNIAANSFDPLFDGNIYLNAQLVGNLTGTASYSNKSLSASYAPFTQTYQENTISSSWASSSLSSSYIRTTTLQLITASWAQNSVSSRWTVSASFASSSFSSSYSKTSSLSISASYYPPQVYQVNTISASFASSSISSSLARTSSYFNQRWLNTGSLYPITSSWAINASFANSAESATSAFWSTTSSYSYTASYFGGFVTQSFNNITRSNFVVLSQSTGSNNGAWFDYVVSSGSNLRVGTVMGGWIAGSLTQTEYSTTDIGNTNVVTMSVVLSANNVQFVTNIWTGLNWKIKVSSRYI